MANSVFNISDIFRQTFGYEAPPAFTIENAVPRRERGDFGAKFYGNDLLGREHFMPVILNGYLIPFAVMGITCRKNIVSTQMAERKGSVHEIINIDDYMINIKGILVSDDQEFPEGEMKMLLDMFEINRSLVIKSVKTDLFLKGDDKVLIKDMPMPPSPGSHNVQTFEINLVSDLVYTLTL